MRHISLNGLNWTVGTPTEAKNIGLTVQWKWEARLVLIGYGGISMGDMVQAIGLTDTFDWAVPQGWANQHIDFHHYVWLYDAEAKIFGRPYNVWEAFEKLGGLVRDLYDQSQERIDYKG